MGRRVSNTGKAETVAVPVRRTKTTYDFVKHDGVMKEMVKKQEDLLETWTSRWDFLTNPKEYWKKEANERGFHYEWSSGTRHPEPGVLSTQPCDQPPRISSRMIGWRVLEGNNMDRIVGPLYVSPKSTIDPPLGPDEPDVRKHQHCFFIA